MVYKFSRQGTKDAKILHTFTRFFLYSSKRMHFRLKFRCDISVNNNEQTGKFTPKLAHPVQNLFILLF